MSNRESCPEYQEGTQAGAGVIRRDGKEWGIRDIDKLCVENENLKQSLIKLVAEVKNCAFNISKHGLPATSEVLYSEAERAEKSIIK